MSILIKGMDTPESCPCELLGTGYDLYCSFARGIPARVKEYYECCQNNKRPSWCPLAPVLPHGRLIDAEALKHILNASKYYGTKAGRDFADMIAECDAADVVEIPKTGIGDLSDGYHTFNGLYEQRMILFAALVKAYKELSWKSYRHEDGEYCFGGGWFIVGIDTPEGSYTYHYKNEYWDMFDCQDVPRAKHWDGHTEADAETRLMSLQHRGRVNEIYDR